MLLATPLAQLAPLVFPLSISFPFFPPQASSVAGQVDGLYFFLLGLSAFFTVAVATTVVVFALKYRRTHSEQIPEQIEGNMLLELTWSIIPLGLALFTFAWATAVFFNISRPPDNAVQMYVVGKQWMWKVQHPEGVREINALHVPLGQPVKLLMATEDVIHSFYIPAFRMKADVVPGKYTSMWFTPTKPGTFHLFCAEYCGTKHSGMIGDVVVMEPAAYQQWLAGGPNTGSMVSRGEKLFTDLACVTCHLNGPSQRGPSLIGVPGKLVQLASGGTVIADDNYLRESILNPSARVVAGYQPVMPSFQGLVNEEGLMALLTYVKSLTPDQSGSPAAVMPSAAVPSTGHGAVPGSNSSTPAIAVPADGKKDKQP